LDELRSGDVDFIFELLNTPGWIRFIGDRNIKTKEDAAIYIQKILYNQGVRYWVVKLKKQLVPVGIITFIKREYLSGRDLGFAFLPDYFKHGYAYEAASVVLSNIIMTEQQILATTVPDNTSSIRLLKKLGFGFDRKINHNETELLLYKVTSDKMQIDGLVKSFFGVFNNTNHHMPDWKLLQRICIPEILIIKKQESVEITYNLVSFIEPRKQLLEEGILVDFEEHEAAEETTISGQIAQRFSVYKKSGYLNGNHFSEQGKKFFQFIKTSHGWKICSVIWEDDQNRS